MKIAICDDEKIFIDMLYRIIGFIEEHEVSTYTDPQKLVADIAAGKHFDIVFCDIMMDSLNGIEVGRQIRKYDDSLYLIYLTSVLEYAPQGYEVNAFRYLLKPVKEDIIISLLDEIKSRSVSDAKIKLDTIDGSILVNPKKILYVEAMDKELELVFENDSIVLRETLSDMEDLLLPHGFFRIHRTFLVNLAAIEEYDSSRLTLSSGKVLPISRRKSTDFQNAMMMYLSGVK